MNLIIAAESVDACSTQGKSFYPGASTASIHFPPLTYRSDLSPSGKLAVKYHQSSTFSLAVCDSECEYLKPSFSQFPQDMIEEYSVFVGEH